MRSNSDEDLTITPSEAEQISLAEQAIRRSLSADPEDEWMNKRMRELSGVTGEERLVESANRLCDILSLGEEIRSLEGWIVVAGARKALDPQSLS